MFDQFLRYVGITTIVVVGGLFILTLFAPIPPFGYWFKSAALFQAVAVLFAGAVGVKGLQDVPKWPYRGLLAAAVLLSGFAWWQAAEQSAATDRQTKLNENTNKVVKEIATKVGVSPDQSAEELAKAIINRLTRPWRLHANQKDGLVKELESLRARGIEFPIVLLPIRDDKNASIFAEEITDLMASMSPRWPYVQPASNWASVKTEGLHVAYSNKEDPANLPKSVSQLEEALTNSGIPIGHKMSQQNLGKNTIGLVIGSKPIGWESLVTR